MLAAITIVLTGLTWDGNHESMEIHDLGTDETLIVCAAQDAECIASEFIEPWADFEARRRIAETK